MDLNKTEISFICLESSFDHRKGSLKLALPFYCHHGDDIPENIKLHVKNSVVWDCKFVKSSFSIEGLKDMMNTYSLKVCDVAVLCYGGGGDFFVTFYNRYAVEKRFDNEVRVSPSDVISAGFEDDKLFCTFFYNAYLNFDGLYSLEIESAHLEDKSTYKVLSRDACIKLGLTEDVKIIKLGFENIVWKLKLIWSNGEPEFSFEWSGLVKVANLLVGDVVTLYKFGNAFDYKLAIFENNIILDQSLNGGNANFLKIMTSEALDAGELEVPRVFIQEFRHTLTNILHIELGGGYSTEFKFSELSNKIYDMHQFIIKYDIDDDYMLIFNYLGGSKFGLAVYDTQRCNYLRDEEGNFRFDDFSDGSYVPEVIVLSDDDEYNEPENEEIMGNAEISFNATLKKSHVDQQTHGVYIPKFMWHIFQNHGKRTNVTLRVGEMEWKVDVLRTQKQFRFSKGWDLFTKDNVLVPGQVIRFEFVGNSTFEVRV